VRAIARLVKLESNQARVNFPAPARLILRADEDDTVYYQVLGFKGELLAGDKDIPPVSVPDSVEPDLVMFRDEEIAGEDVRVAYQFLQPADGASSKRLVVLQVAETRNKRSTLASRVVTGVLLPQFAIIPIAVILVWLGLSRGIAPLNQLQSLIRRRRPSDLSPISVGGVPEEVRPLIIAFNDMMARLEENLQAQQRFIADAAHQMRTPLTGLRMQTDLALMETDPAQVHRSLMHISQSAERASHLINQLLSLARAEASYEKIYAVERVDLDVLCCAPCSATFVPRARQKNIDFGLETTGEPLVIDGNPVLLSELVKNLIDNAIKYTPEGGCVTVRTIATERAILEVEDTGIGVPDADRERVFERFYRVLGSSESGSGLGLPIVREIAELHRAQGQPHSQPQRQGHHRPGRLSRAAVQPEERVTLEARASSRSTFPPA
jgi:two-component system sensor histidine kinase TctE